MAPEEQRDSSMSVVGGAAAAVDGWGCCVLLRNLQRVTWPAPGGL
jgi:hypothetical protein